MFRELTLCGDVTENVSFGLFDFSIAPSFLYYFYIPVLFLSFFIIIFFTFFSPKYKIKKYFIFTLLVFSFWQINEIVQWTAIHNEIIFFSWQIIAILHPLMVFSVVLLIERLVKIGIKDFPVSDNVAILFLFFVPVLLLMSTSYNFVYDIFWCQGILGDLWFYIYFVEIILFLSLLYKILKYRKSFESKKMFYYIFISTLILLSVFIFNDLMGAFFLFYEVNIIIPTAFVLFILISVFFIGEANILKIRILLPQVLVSILLFLNFSMLFIRTIENIRIILVFTIIFTGLIGYFLIKSVKQIEKQKEQLSIANKNQESLMHFISHQVKGYLTKSRNIFDAILNGDYGPINDKIKKVSEHGFESQTSGVKTVQNLLKASNLKSGKFEFKKTNFDLKIIIEDLIKDLESKAANKKIKITKELPKNSIIINGDILSMKEVFKNILDNAILYTNEGEINIKLEDLNNEVKFSVKDTGIGISKDDFGHLFKEGGKGSESLKYNIDSSGYGLFIVKNIINQHGGNIFAKSEGKGKGSEFIVELPK